MSEKRRQSSQSSLSSSEATPASSFSTVIASRSPLFIAARWAMAIKLPGAIGAWVIAAMLPYMNDAR